MQLDWAQLLRAFEPTEDGQYGVDPTSGTVRFFDAHELGSDDPVELWDLDRYIMVEPIPDWQVEEWWEEFRDGIPPAERARLPVRPQEARRALRGQPELRAAWKEFRSRRMHAWVERWVAEQRLRPENPPPWRETG